MATMNLMGTEYRVVSLEWSDETIRGLRPGQLANYLEMAEMEQRVAANKRLDGLAAEIGEVVKRLRAQRKINDNADSLKHGIICG